MALRAESARCPSADGVQRHQNLLRETPVRAERRDHFLGANPTRAMVSWPLVSNARRMLAVKPVEEPNAGNPHVRFDERGGETGSLCGTAPLLDSTVGRDSLLRCGRLAPGRQPGRSGRAHPESEPVP
jgi:hypothetical protein